nr:serine/threonine protein kinase kin1 [Quercus suber]
MTGFDFGAADVITAQLTRIIESEDYQRAVRLQERRQLQQGPEQERKRGVFDFYKRRNSTTSRDTLNTPSAETLGLGQDPVNAFHPLISVYYLAMEKQEREARESNPGALAMPQSPGEQPLAIPDLTAPQAAYTNHQTYEMAGERPTGGRSRPRARTHGEDEVQQGLQNVNVDTAPSPTNPIIVEPPSDQQAQSGRKESTAAGLLRRLSTRRQKEPLERPDRSDRPTHPPSSLSGYNSPAEGPKKSFSVRRTRDRESSQTRLQAEPTAGGQGVLLTPPVGVGDAASDKSSKRSFGLGRSISVNSSDMRRRLSRRGVSEGSSMRPPMNSTGSNENRPPQDHHANRDTMSDAEATSSRPRTTGATSRTRSVGHARKESMQQRRTTRDMSRTADVPEETDQEIQEEMAIGNTYNPDFQPVYLKGMFSVRTTSSKSPQFIHADIVRVLNQLGVQFVEVKGGFRCKHAPSIRAQGEDFNAVSPSSPADAQHRRKISFGGLRNSSAADRDALRATQPATPRQKQGYMTEEDSEDDVAPQPTRHHAAHTAGETSTHVQSDFGDNMVLKFEIFVVKVPILSLHGIQFKKVDGGTWQYKNMAQTIIKELRL